MTVSLWDFEATPEYTYQWNPKGELIFGQAREKLMEGNDSPWELFDLEKIAAAPQTEPVSYQEFLRVPAMSCGIYRLAKGSTDMQTPHDEDELYYVVKGKALLRVGDEVKEVKPGSMMYVRATESHSFFEIQEDMILLVVFPTGKF